MTHRDLYIGGKWMSGYGKTIHSLNPATNEKVWEGSQASNTDVERAVKAAREAFPDWARRTFEERVQFLKIYQEHLIANQEKIATTISQEMGKPLWESRQEASSMIAKIEISINAYRERCPQKTLDHSSGQLVTRHKPHGVIAVLGPFNFPGHLPNGHIVPALLAGNTIVFKPSEYCPLTGIQIMECLEAAGIPPGVVNLINGRKETGIALSHHEGIDGLFFTGSFGAGQTLAEWFAKRPEKILALEMGGNNPLIVDRVSDIKAAAYMTLQSAYLTSGQRCTCARRLILIENDQTETFIGALQEMISGIHIGSYEEKPEPFMGPVVSEEAVVKLLSFQAILQSLGGKPINLLKQLKENMGFVNPGLIDVTEATDRPDQEIFGPFLQLIRVPDFDKALQEANQTRFGLSAGLLSDEKEKFEQFLRGIKAGVVNWNVPLTGASSHAPFGGVGCSGNSHPSGYYAADYSAYPVASIEAPSLQIPQKIPPGLSL